MQGDTGDFEFNPWVRKIPQRWAWQPSVFLSGESHEQRSLADYIPQGGRRVEHDEVCMHNELLASF